MEFNSAFKGLNSENRIRTIYFVYNGQRITNTACSNQSLRVEKTRNWTEDFDRGCRSEVRYCRMS
jgi:hypothetical protein